MKIKSLLMTALLLALTVGNMNAQTEIRCLGSLREASPYDQDFEGETIGDWTFVIYNGEGGYGLSGEYYEEYEINHTQEGLSSFYVEPYNTDFYGYLISPALESFANTGFNLEFWYTNYFKWTSASLRVGYLLGDMADVDDFNPEDNQWNWGNIISATQGTMEYECEDCVEGWTPYFNDFRAGTTRIAIGIPYSMGSLFLDDFVINKTSCSKPIVSEIVSEKTSLTLSWEGSNDSYVVRYKGGFPTSFEFGFEGWTTINDDEDVYNWDLAHEEGEGHNGSDYYVYSESYHAEDTHTEELWPDNYLVSPLVPLGGSITFWAKGLNEMDYMEHFGVAISTDGNQDPDDFETIIEWTAMDDWMKYTVDLSQYSGMMGYVAIRHFRCDECDAQSALCVDDITIFTTPNWTEMAPTEETSVMINDLMYETNYVIQLKGICDGGNSSTWTDELYAMTSNADCRFIKAGDWNVAANWRNGSIPDGDSDVVIAAAATIPANCLAQSNNINLSMGSITIQDGGQLKHHNAGVFVTMEKDITGYENEDGNDHYYLLGFPNESSLSPAMVTNMMPTGDEFDYDLYYFAQYEDNAEWANYKDVSANPDNFWFFTSNGFLYARSEDATLSATFELNPSGESYTIESVPYVEGHTFSGWNLIANPFACNAYLSGNRGFYRLVETAEGSRIQLANEDNGGSVIAPMEGIFVQVAPGGENITFTTTESAPVGAMMNFTLRKASLRSATTLDRSRVVFGEGRNVGHLDLMADPSRIYFPIDDKAMSVVYSQPVGELPLNLEVATEGAFVLAFDCRAENLVYCHLIDNLTGADVDLLQQPEYAFEARVSDYASRFRVVFAKANEDGATVNDEFAYLFNGNLVVTNEGLATLQVIDVQGRMISSETIDGCVSKNLQAAPGVYVLRLINGDNVMTQKIVVR